MDERLSIPESEDSDLALALFGGVDDLVAPLGFQNDLVAAELQSAE